MVKQEPTPRTMSIAEVVDRLPHLVNQVSRNEIRVLVEQAGQPVAALVSAEDLRRLSDLDRAWDERTEAIERFSQAFADVPTEQAEADVARIIDEGRRRRAAKAERQPA